MAAFTNAGRAKREHHMGFSLPMSHEEGAIGAVPLIVFGAVFAAFPLGFAFLAITRPENVSGDGGPLALALFLSVFLLVGLGIMTWGVGCLRHRVEFRVDARRVRGLRRRFSTVTWDEPLTAYRGVMEDTERHSQGKNRAAIVIGKCVLKHFQDPRFDVELARERGGDMRATVERYARLFDKPVLVANESDGARVASPGGPLTVAQSGRGAAQVRAAPAFHERAVEDLDKSVGELAREGKIEARFDPSDALWVKGLNVERRDGGYAFVLSLRSTSGVILPLLFGGVGVGLLYWYFGPGVSGVSGDVEAVPIVGGAFTVAGILIAALSVSAGATLVATPGRVETWVSLFGARVMRGTMAAADVEEVTASPRTGLRIRGDRGSMLFYAPTLDAAGLEVVRAGVISVFARGASGAQADTTASEPPVAQFQDVADLGKKWSRAGRKFRPVLIVLFIGFFLYQSGLGSMLYRKLWAERHVPAEAVSAPSSSPSSPAGAEKPAPAPSKPWDDYLRAAQISMGKRQYDEAGRRFDKAIAFVEQNVGADHPVHAFVLYHAATLYKRLGDDANRLDRLERAWRVVAKRTDAEIIEAVKPQWSQVLIESVPRWIGEHYLALGRADDAIEMFSHAMAASQRPTSGMSDYSRTLAAASNLVGIGRAECLRGDAASAEQVFAEVGRLLPALEKPTAAKLRAEVGNGCG